jgi:hypothetical protein
VCTYVVLNGSEEKHGQINPDIIGPFDDQAAAFEWLEGDGYKAWLKFEIDCHGGWPTAIIVSDETAISPEQWEANHDFLLDDVEAQ